MNETSQVTGMLVKRIVVATDYSPAARRAVWRAGHLAKRHGAHLHLVHAQPDWNLFSQGSPGAAEYYRAVTQHAENALRLELAWLETTFGVQARGENRMGRASHVMRSVIAEIEPHLVVAGAHGEHSSPQAAPLLGGTAMKLIAFSPVPTLIVRGPDQPYRRALAAVETSVEGSRQLIRWAEALLESGECHVVHAVDVPCVERMRAHGITESALRDYQMDVRKAAGAIVDNLLNATGQTHLRLHAHLLSGEPVSSVLQEIEDRKPDVTIVGKHQHPPRENLLASLGSVALRIAYHASSDVLVVP